MSKPLAELPTWVPFTLKCAAIYNLLWGGFVVLFPRVPFFWLGLDTPNYPSIIQCLGMVIGVYGIGYWIAARDAATHWPIVLVGLLGKVFGPIGFVFTAFGGDLPWAMGIAILTNDIAWWVPFTAILIHAARINEARRTTASGITLEEALRTAVTQKGWNLFDESHQAPLLLVCIRHFGCTFCREALANLAADRDEVGRHGLVPVIVYMVTDEQAARELQKYGLNDVAHVSDPERRLFQTLELPFGTLSQLISWKTMWRALGEGVVFKHGFGGFVGNALQLSGDFIVRNGRVERAIRHSSPADKTDFAKLSCEIG